jgi:hypothetical protein
VITAIPGQPGLFRHGLGDAALDARRVAFNARNTELRGRVAAIKDRVLPLLRYFPGALDPLTLRSTAEAIGRLRPSLTPTGTMVTMSQVMVATVIKAAFSVIFGNLDLAQVLGGLGPAAPVTDAQFQANSSKIRDLQTAAWGSIEALENFVEGIRTFTDVVDIARQRVVDLIAEVRRGVGLGWVDLVVEGAIYIVAAALLALLIERMIISYNASRSAEQACEQQLRSTGTPCTGDQLLAYRRQATQREAEYGLVPNVGRAVGNVGEAASGAIGMIPLVLGVVGIAAVVAYSKPGTAGYSFYEQSSAAAARAAASAKAAASRAAESAKATAARASERARASARALRARAAR